MEVQNNNIQGRRAPSEPAIDLTRPNREIVRKAVEEGQSKEDKLDISPAAAELAKQAQTDELRAEAHRKARVEELRSAYFESRLNSPERIAKAAQAILRGDKPEPDSE